MESQGTTNSQNNLGEKKKDGRLTLLDFKTYDKIYSNKKYGTGIKTDIYTD